MAFEFRYQPLGGFNSVGLSQVISANRNARAEQAMQQRVFDAQQAEMTRQRGIQDQIRMRLSELPINQELGIPDPVQAGMVGYQLDPTSARLAGIATLIGGMRKNAPQDEWFVDKVPSGEDQESGVLYNRRTGDFRVVTTGRKTKSGDRIKMTPTEIVDAQKRAEGARSGLELTKSIDNALNMVNTGIYSGFGANWKLTGSKIGAQVGMTGPTDKAKASNTEKFRAYLGDVVLPLMKSLGGNDTEEERKYIASVVAGNETLEEPTIRGVLDSYKKKVGRSLKEQQAFEKALDETYSHVPPGARAFHGQPEAEAPPASKGNPLEYNGYVFPNEQALKAYKKAAGAK